MLSCTSTVSGDRSPPAGCLEVLQEEARPEQTLAGLLNKRELISSSKLYTGQRHTEQRGQRSHPRTDGQTDRQTGKRRMERRKKKEGKQREKSSERRKDQR